MPTIIHKVFTGTELHESFHYVQAVDPGPVGPGLYWLDTSNTPYVLNRRDPTNLEWISVTGGSGTVLAQAFTATGLTGAANQTRFAGATTGGSPSTGTWQQGDLVVDYNGKIWVCTTGGTPGFWHQAGDSGTLNFAFGGAGVPITSGIKGDFRVDTDVNIIGWRMYADAVGTITADLWKATHSTFPPTVTNSIIGAGGTQPSISASDHSQFLNLSGWSTLISKGSVLRLNVSGVATITRATLALEVLRV